MALDAELLSLKSAGTYRFERDLSTISNDSTTISNLRLIVGFSKIGPFNTVNLVTNVGNFIKLYGNIDRSLEKRGSYFHRSALVALSAGTPILCLNLLSLDPDLDNVYEKSLSTNVEDVNKYTSNIPLHSVFNTDKFWNADAESFLDGIKLYLNEDNATGTGETGAETDWNGGLLHFTNISKKPMSILVKKANAYNTKGYELTIDEWFGKENVPEYLNGSSFVSDYMIEVYVVGGNFGPSLKKEGIILNSKVDIDDDGNVEKLEYFSEDKNPYKRFSSDIIFQSYFDENGFIRKNNESDTTDTKLNSFLSLPSVNLIGKFIGSLIPDFTDKLGRNIWIQKLVNDNVDSLGLLCAENVELIEGVEVNDDGYVNEKIDLIGNNLFHLIVSNTNPIREHVNFLSYDFNLLGVVSDDSGDSNSDITISTNISTEFYYKDMRDANGEYRNIIGNYFYKNDKLNEANKIIIKNNECVLDKDSNIKPGDYLLSYYNHDEGFSRLTRVIRTSYIYSDSKEKCKKVICSDKIHRTGFDVNNRKVIKIEQPDNLCNRLHWIYLNGFTIRKDSMPDGTNERQNKILDLLREEPIYPDTISTLFKALKDRDYVQWRYLVDTFGYGIEEESKNVYTKLCKARQSALAIVNCPSLHDFKKSPDPSFVDKSGGVSVEYIANGANLDKNPGYLYTLPNEENGASYGAYYYPYLRISDLGGIKSVPPAAYVSNLFIQKYKKSNPWAIVAGQKRGVISGNQVIGVESTLINENRDWLEPKGINSIIWENGIGVEVYSNKTAKQSPKSALSSIHVREVCIYIQDTIESILRKYVFEFNTAQTRLEIKTLVDDFLESVKINKGIYNYNTVMDTSNNNDEVIDNNIGIIDIEIEPVKGMEMLAQRLTIVKTGTIISSSFE